MTPVRITKPMPLKGLRSSWPPDALGDDYSPDCLNVRFRFGEIRPTPGRGVLSGIVANETPLYIGAFSLSDGTIWPVMLTSKKLWRWGRVGPGTPRQWHQVQPGDTVPGGSTRWSVAFGEGVMFFAREEDLIYYWDGNPDHPFRSIAAQPGVQGSVPKAKYVEYFNNRLVCGFTIEGANIFSNRVRWAESGNYLHWDSTLGLGAGFLDLLEEKQEPIKGIRALGDSMVILSRSALKEMTGTRTLDPVHVTSTRIRGVGSNAAYTIAASGQLLFFMGYDRNIYAWNGGTLSEIGEPVYEEIKGITSFGEMDKYIGIVVQHRQEYWLILPSGDAFIFDYARGAWSRDTVPAFTTMGEVEDTIDSVTWNDLVGSWDAQTKTWFQFTGTQITTIFGGRANGSTSIVNEQVAYDYFAIGSIMDRFLETPDIYMGDVPGWKVGNIMRMLLIYKFVNTQQFEVAISFDHGASWLRKFVTPNQQGFSHVDFDQSGNVVRFRFRENNTSGAFRWRSYSYEVLPVGDFTQGST